MNEAEFRLGPFHLKLRVHHGPMMIKIILQLLVFLAPMYVRAGKNLAEFWDLFAAVPGIYQLRISIFIESPDKVVSK
jgi:hypothetical protein